ncbi:MAG: DUF4129 domain-containing protein [Candidatus Melainabacteria bacterium]|nr:DUF4129 domain-containing protein [Candidatus Melainabacteria bacterium]
MAQHYQYGKPPDFLLSLQDVIASLLRWVADLLHSFHIAVPGLSDSRMVGNLMQLALYAAGIACALIFTVLVWLRLIDLQRQNQLAKKKSSFSQSHLDSRAWQQQAFTLAQENNWRLSCRALQLGLLCELDETHLVAFAPAKTNHEYCRNLAQYPVLQSIFRAISSTVEEVWFGNRQASRDDFELCLSQLTSARQELQNVTERIANS